MENKIEPELKEKIRQIIGQEDLELIDFKLSFYGGKYLLRCIVDYTQGGVTIDKCAELNGKIFSAIEESSVLGDDFTVEVNSPGIDRPLKNYKDFLRAKANVVGVWLGMPVENKLYIEGKILEANEKYILLKAKDKDYIIELDKIKTGKARLDL